jgi:FkbM family methyltransferase
MIKLIKTAEGVFAVLRDDTHVSRWVEQKGSLRTDGMLDTVLPMMKEGDYVVDGGANIGDWTASIAKTVGPTGMVYAFEPMPATAACLYFNVRDFTNVIVCNSALSDKMEVTAMSMDPNAGASHITNRMIASKGVFVAAVMLDMVPFPRLDWIKLDIEGSEFQALIGAEKTLKKFRPKIICELNRGTLARNAITPERVIRLMKDWNYDMQLLDPRHSLDLPQLDVLFTPNR